MSPTTNALGERDPRSPLDPAVFPEAAFTPGGYAARDRFNLRRRTEPFKKRRDPVPRLLKRADFDPDESLRIFLRNLLRARVRRMLSCAGKAAVTGDAEVLHRLRVSARRLQAYLRVFHTCFPNKKFRVYTRALRRLLRTAGCVREYDILISMLEQYRDSRPISERLIFELLISRKSRERREARKELGHILRTVNRKKFGPDFLQFVSAPG